MVARDTIVMSVFALIAMNQTPFVDLCTEHLYDSVPIIRQHSRTA